MLKFFHAVKHFHREIRIRTDVVMMKTIKSVHQLYAPQKCDGGNIGCQPKWGDSVDGGAMCKAFGVDFLPSDPYESCETALDESSLLKSMIVEKRKHYKWHGKS